MLDWGTWLGIEGPSWLHCLVRWLTLTRKKLPHSKRRILGCIAAKENAATAWSSHKDQREETGKLSEASHIPGHIQMTCSFHWQTSLVHISNNCLWTEIYKDFFSLPKQSCPRKKSSNQLQTIQQSYFGPTEKYIFSRKKMHHQGGRKLNKQYYKQPPMLSCPFLPMWALIPSCPPPFLSGYFRAPVLPTAFASSLSAMKPCAILPANTHLLSFLLSPLFQGVVLWTNSGENDGWVIYILIKPLREKVFAAKLIGGSGAEPLRLCSVMLHRCDAELLRAASRLVERAGNSPHFHQSTSASIYVNTEFPPTVSFFFSFFFPFFF